MSLGRLHPVDVCGADPPAVREYTDQEILRLWLQVSRELHGYAKYLNNTAAKLTAAQLRMALQMAGDNFTALECLTSQSVDPPPANADNAGSVQ